MPGIFVSHASRDKDLADLVVQLMILGSGAPPKQVFFSSGPGSGVPAGTRFNDYIRAKVEDADLVVAIVSPSFQESPFSIAEVGAAWVLQGNFFPLTVPGFSHNDLDGVLVGTQVPSLDDPDALAELHDRVCSALELTPNTSGWNTQQAKFLAALDEQVTKLEGPKTVPFEEYERAIAQRDGVQTALREAEQRASRAQELLDEVVKTKTREEALQVVAPADEQAQFDRLHEEARAALRKLPGIVNESLSYWIRGEEMPIPSPWDDEHSFEEVKQALRDGYLYEGSGETVNPDREVRDVAIAMGTLDDLAGFMNGSSEPFSESFKGLHGAPPELGRGLIWGSLFN